MRDGLLNLLRCPFCGGRFTIIENDALVRGEGRIETGVLGCECCAFPIVAGIPVLIADDATRDAMHQMEAGRHEQALFTLLGLDEARGTRLRSMLARGGGTYREALATLSLDAEAECFLYRFSDPTYVQTQAVLRAIGQNRWAVSRPILDLCGGPGHVTRTLADLHPGQTVVDADVYFWKLWTARRYVAPQCDAVCCDANSPLPFARDVFSLVVLADAFPYIWHKRLLAEEMMRLAVDDGVLVMPHLHSALGENFSPGNALTPQGYHDLFAPQQPRLFSDERMFEDVLQRGVVDLAEDVSPAALESEPSLTLVASRRRELFRQYEVRERAEIAGVLAVNPLYRIERRDDVTVLTLTFPTAEYEEEFGQCREYLPERLTVRADLTGRIEPAALGPELEELRHRRVIIDAPPRYL